MNERYISIQVLVDRIMQREIFKSLMFDNAIRWALDCIQFVGNPEFYIEQIANIEISNYRGRVPYDLVDCIKLEVSQDDDSNSDNRYSMRMSGDPFLKDRPNRDSSKPSTYYRDFSYRIEGNYIFCDLENGTVQMAYRALPLDDNGYIMFPNVVELIAAIEHYIKFKHFEILEDLGQVPMQKVVDEERDYLFYVGAAQARHFLENLDSARTMANIQGQLLPNPFEHEDGYRYLGKKEFYKKH